MSDYKLKNVCDFDLAQTLECGQCFHFVKLDEEDYVLAAKGHVLHVSQEDDTVTFYDTEEDEYVNESILIDNLDVALVKSDIIVITLPLTDDTKHLINEEKINMIDKLIEGE